MSLRDFVPKKEQVEIGDTSITVSGITVSTLADMVDRHLDEMVQVFGGGKTTLNDIVKKSPDFAATLIAQCAGEPDAVEAAKQLPLGIQVQALRAIWKLSQISPEEVGNAIRELSEGMGRFDNAAASVESLVSTSLKKTPKKVRSQYDDSDLGATISSA